MEHVQKLARNVQGAAQMVQCGYEELVAAVIRPPRAEYELEDLGPHRFIFAGRVYQRQDFEVVSDRAEPARLRCSRWALEVKDGEFMQPRPCVIFLHGNASCRVQGAGLLKTVLGASCDLVAFDFGGSGCSEGEFVSLGHFEKEDLKAVIRHLLREGLATNIGLWGRSMGAVTALMHAHRDMAISALVLDSPFHDFRALASELCEKETYGAVPEWLAGGALAVVKVSIQKRAGFDVDELVPSKYAGQTQVPAIFAAAHDDDFIFPYHSRVLQSMYGGQSTLIMMDGDHNTPRPQWFLDEAKHFFARALRGPSSQLQEQGASMAAGGPGHGHQPVSFTPIYMPPSSEALPQEDAPLAARDPSAQRGTAEDRRAAFEAPKDSPETVMEQLFALGFSRDAVEAAMKRNSTLESCVEWILTNSGD